MERTVKIMAPPMPDFIQMETFPGPRQAGFNPDAGKIPVTDLTEKEAEEYGELMKQTFIGHWKNKKSEQ